MCSKPRAKQGGERVICGQRKNKRQEVNLPGIKYVLPLADCFSFLSLHVAYYLVNWSNDQMEEPEQKEELESGRIQLLDTWGVLSCFCPSRRGEHAVMLLDGPGTHPNLLTTSYIHLVQWQIRINKKKHRWTITGPLGLCPYRSSPPRFSPL